THTDFQKRGIAREVMARLIRKAAFLGVDQIRLDSDPSRFAANALYADIGFRHYDGNSYKLFI
ncbi:MAG: GNAT family N-acetyltransferase, partial [Patescibacteria group bacterium]